MSTQQNLIAALAVLKVNADRGIDYLDSLVPLLVAILPAPEEPRITLDQAGVAIRDEFGLEIPTGALRSVAARAKRRDAAAEKAGGWARQPGASPDAVKATREAALRQFAQVAHSIAKFSRRFGIDWSDVTAGDALLDFLEEHSADVLRLAVNGRPLAAPSPDVDHAEFIVGSFLVEVLDTDASAFDFVVTLVKGGMLAGALVFPDIGAVSRNFQDTLVLFDTRVVLQALGWEGDRAAANRLALVSALRDLGAQPAIFRRTADEVAGVLNYVAAALRDRRVLRTALGPTLQFAVDNRITASDVELRLVHLERDLGQLGLRTVESPPYVPEHTVDETELDGTLRAVVRQRRDEARAHDVAVVSSVYRLRQGAFPRRIESCGGIFVTSNRNLERAARQFLQQQYSEYKAHDVVPAVLSVDTLTTIVWLKSPQRQPDLPRHRVLADCYAALNPPDDLWQKYLHEISRLQTQKDLSADDYFLLRYSVTARTTLMQVTVGDAARFKPEDVEVVLKSAIEHVEEPLISAMRALEEQLAKTAGSFSSVSEDLLAARTSATTERRERDSAEAERDEARRQYLDLVEQLRRQGVRDSRVIDAVSGASGWAAGCLVFVVLVALLLGGTWFVERGLPGGFLAVLATVAVLTVLAMGLIHVIFGWSVITLAKWSRRSVTRKSAETMRRWAD